MGKLIAMKVLIVGLKGVGIETGEPSGLDAFSSALPPASTLHSRPTSACARVASRAHCQAKTPRAALVPVSPLPPTGLVRRCRLP